MNKGTLILDGKYLWEGKSHFLWLLDPGHGGMTPEGRYTTAPAKQWKFPDGLMIYEGVVNRQITEFVRQALHAAQIDYAVVADEVEDTSLEQRVRTADAIYGKDKRAVYLSIHSNAGGGEGFELFSGPGQTDSDKIVNVFQAVYRNTFPEFKFRGVKEENFYVLRKTDCPAILVENLFFDNREEAEYLLSTAGQKAIAACIVHAIQECERLKPI